MMFALAFSLTAAAVFGCAGQALAAPPASDRIETSAGPLRITFLGHASLRFDFAGKVLYVDPWSKTGDYAAMPRADLVLLTHEHQDHLDRTALDAVAGPETPVVLTEAARAALGRGTVLANGQETTVAGIRIEAVPAYNRKHTRPSGEPFHPKGRGNGYVLTFGDKRVYVAGDTEDIPEMAALARIDVAFLPMNLPYTMTPEMTAAAARSFSPKILYPYHYGETDPALLAPLLAGTGIEVRVRLLR